MARRSTKSSIKSFINSLTSLPDHDDVFTRIEWFLFRLALLVSFAWTLYEVLRKKLSG